MDFSSPSDNCKRELLFTNATSQGFLCMSERLNSIAIGVWHFMGVLGILQDLVL